jgi:hypothetical protein
MILAMRELMVHSPIHNCYADLIVSTMEGGRETESGSLLAEQVPPH